MKLQSNIFQVLLTVGIATFAVAIINGDVAFIVIGILDGYHDGASREFIHCKIFSFAFFQLIHQGIVGFASAGVCFGVGNRLSIFFRIQVLEISICRFEI